MLLGPHTKLDTYEETIIEILLKQNKELYFPVFDTKLLGTFNRKLKENSPDYSSEIFFLSGGIIIPLDLLDLKKHKTFTKKGFVEKNNKFISTFDVLFLYEQENAIIAHPLDFKSGGAPDIDSKNDKHSSVLNQISSYNAAYLISQTPFLREIMKKIEEETNKKIIIDSGYFILGKNKSNNYKSEQNKIEEELKKSLKLKNIYGALNITINPNNKKALDISIKKNEDEPIKASNEYHLSKTTYDDMKNELRFLKNRIKYRGFYGNTTIAVGANRKGELVKQLEYFPATSIKTYTPRTEKLEYYLGELERNEDEFTKKQESIDQKIRELETQTPNELKYELFNKEYNAIYEKLYRQGEAQINERKKRIEESTKRKILEIDKKVEIILKQKELTQQKIEETTQQIKNSKSNYENAINELKYLNENKPNRFKKKKRRISSRITKTEEEIQKKEKERNDLKNYKNTSIRDCKKEAENKTKTENNTRKLILHLEQEKLELKNFYKKIQRDLEENKQREIDIELETLQKVQEVMINKKPKNEKKRLEKTNYLIKLTKMVTNKTTKYNTLKSEIFEAREKLYNELQKLNWFTEEGFNILQNYRTQKIENYKNQKEEWKQTYKLMKRKIQNNIYKEQEIVKKQKLDDKLEDEKLTKEIKKFHRNIPYKTSKNSNIKDNPLILYINLNNTTVYKAQFYNKIS
ncbi:hypothetical protein K9L97_02675 [Candidatus Woesearchaeota archaeon]|nr:hypothetical protein [Candidatus Woesearchaeota archaeon]